jgi:hypothetical protein
MEFIAILSCALTAAPRRADIPTVSSSVRSKWSKHCIAFSEKAGRLGPILPSRNLPSSRETLYESDTSSLSESRDRDCARLSEGMVHAFVPSFHWARSRADHLLLIQPNDRFLGQTGLKACIND